MLREKHASALPSTGIFGVRGTPGHPAQGRQGMLMEWNGTWFSPSQDSNTASSLAQMV